MAVALLGAACGGTGGGGPAIPGLASEDSKAPTEILKDAQAALRGAKTVTVHFSGSSSGSRVDLTLTSDGKGNAQGSGNLDTAPVQLLVYSGTFYMKGPAFFAKLAPATVTPEQKQQFLATIADRWVSFGSSSTAGVGDLANLGQPAVLADCLDAHGTLAKGGTDTVNSKKAIVLTNKGDAPGDSPGKLYIAVDSPHYPLRIVQSGAVTPGTAAVHGKCPTSTSSDSSGSSANQDVTIDLSDFDKSVTISAPVNPLDVSKLLTGG